MKCLVYTLSRNLLREYDEVTKSDRLWKGVGRFFKILTTPILIPLVLSGCHEYTFYGALPHIIYNRLQ